MTDLFQDKAEEWDTRPLPQQISDGVVSAICAQVELHSALTVLDFGAGTGLVCGKLAPRVGQILAVDVSEAMLARLAEKEELVGKVTPICRNILEAPLDQRVELVVSAMAMHHVEDTASMMEALFAHLEPGGVAALADLDTEPGTFHPPGIEGVFHHGFDRAEIRAHAEAAGFVDVELQTACTVDRDEGRFPIFLLTARKPAA